MASTARSTVSFAALRGRVAAAVGLALSWLALGTGADAIARPGSVWGQALGTGADAVAEPGNAGGQALTRPAAGQPETDAGETADDTSAGETAGAGGDDASPATTTLPGEVILVTGEPPPTTVWVSRRSAAMPFLTR